VNREVQVFAEWALSRTYVYAVRHTRID
jgi:hypothetical protein